MLKEIKKNNKGFTLMEILVAILIISVILAIAIPLYTTSVDKTRFISMIPISRSLKSAEENFFLSKGRYTDDIKDLSIAVSNDKFSDTDFLYDIQTTQTGSQFNVIKTTNKQLVNVRLAFYLDNNSRLSGQLHCEAREEDNRANKLCKNALNGKEIYNTDDGYTAYILNSEMNIYTCSYMGGFWSSSKEKCYESLSAKCTDLGLNVVEGTNKCGYTNSSGNVIGEGEVCLSTKNNGCNNSIIGNGGECLSDNNGNGCKDVTIQSGGECVVDGSLWGCTKSSKGITVEPGGRCVANNAWGDKGGYSCEGYYDGAEAICTNSRYCGWRSTFDNGSICVGIGGTGACYGSYFKNGSICYANGPGACSGYVSADQYFDETSCCCGNYCPKKAPKCVDMGITCDEQYLS